ncbi:hypothetical protein H4582DRAFT_1939954 [Lactarius indigo]|nr:hypothetical protein H4582DRAFT_1939954 [Lactarius indigo]
MARTHTMLEMAARDGPLLNFCKLGHLGMMAVPFEGSSLRDTDFNKLLNLLQTMMEDPRLTLASTPVWKDLGQLRVEVRDTHASSNEDKTNMRNLLAKIDAVYIRPSSTQEHHPSDHVESQASGTSAVVQSDLPRAPRGPMPSNERFSYASTSTAVGEDLDGSSPAKDDDVKGVTPAPSNNSRGELANLYPNAYPHLPSQIAPSGQITPVSSPPTESFVRPSSPVNSSTPPASPADEIK